MRTRSFLSEFSEGRKNKSESAATRIRATLSGKTLVRNFQILADLAKDHLLLPMIKANAYGHGDVWVAKQLIQQHDLYGYGVASLAEGARLRTEIGLKYRKTRIFVFSDTSPWSDEKGHFCEENGLTPIISSDEDWDLFIRQKWEQRIPYEIKFNTGMNRLGLGLGYVSKVKAHLKKCLQPEHQPTGILTHFACSEEPAARITQSQVDRFKAVIGELSGVAPRAHFHAANSAAIFNLKKLELAGVTTVVRPGLALFGVVPIEGVSDQGLAPVMKLEVRVIHRRTLKVGDSLGYGSTFRVTPAQAPLEVAVCAAGYADGVHRSLSGGGHAVMGGRAFKFIGRVSMDLLTIECARETKVGDWIEILGPNIDPWAQAKEAQTIPYELLTSLSNRVEREYVD